MKKYLLFAGSYYYPSGGINDFVDSFDTIEAARELALCKNPNGWSGYYDWYQVVTIKDGKFVIEEKK